jgi:two-component system response regulator VanR
VRDVNILVLDDEKEIADLVELYLKNDNYNVYKFYDSNMAVECIDTVELDMAIIDAMIKDINGFEICKRIREKGLTFPIIMLTAKVEDIDKINGLSLGADDYVTKPFNPLELMARVKAQLRRYKKYNENLYESEIIDFSGLVINKKMHTCTLYEKNIELTPREFDILLYLCENIGRVVGSEELFEKVWGEKYLDCNNTIMVHIRRIREKMGEPQKNPKFIKTVWGVGYKVEK